MNTPLRCVVDASVVFKLFVAEADSPAAEALFAHLADAEARFFAPSILLPECGNVLWKHVRRFGYSPADAERALQRMRELAVMFVDVEDVLAQALRIAIARDITVYDACYAATAVHVRAPLITADARLAHKLSGANLQVLVLGRFAVPPWPLALE